ncbi:zinc-ribbon domain-containing protein [Paenarthrobacter sp. NPDC018779]|uniref:zinc-ribbon domain-containing protein n=1 Tax=Paenarthrobacter sp. NPDC018779 TaxID=3364375 RepID=UPI0037C90BE4
MSATTTNQLCSAERCNKPAAFKTRSKPAWCTDCIDGILHEGGLRADEPFTGPQEWRLTTCLNCGVRAHYRFVYTLEKNSQQEKTCRACHWMEWAKFVREASGTPTRNAGYSVEEITIHLERSGYDLIATLVDFNDGNDPVVARCRACGRLSAERLDDFSWGCSCSRNVRSSNPVSAKAVSASSAGGSSNLGGSKARKNLLADSDDPALEWWDHERNDEKTFRTVTLRATRTCHWLCPECGLSFPKKVLDMTVGRQSCPDCSEIALTQWKQQLERWRTTPIADVPELAAAWADEDDPRTVMVNGDDSWILRRFKCPAGHHPRLQATTFYVSGCPSCRAAETRKTQKNWLADVLPEIASQWHPSLNGQHTPQTVVWDSRRPIMWRADCCGHEWEASPRFRDKFERLRCPKCQTILGSLAWTDPGLAAEWSPENPQTAWHVRPYAKTSYVPKWICATNPLHVWESPLPGRSNGAECPECKVAGKSKIELAHLAAAKKAFTGVRSGRVLRDARFTTRRSWTADISADLDGQTLVIEYDGAYWHSAPAKILTDERKTLDLLAAGHLVVRLREDNLPSLPVDHANYHEIRVYSTAGRPQETIAEVQTWLRKQI